jgi:hypothetical protein
MYQFEQIYFKQISILLENLSSSTLSSRQFIKNKYSEYALNFEVTLDFLKKIGLVYERQDRIIIKRQYQSLLNKSAFEKEDLLRNLIIENLVFQQNPLLKYLLDFLSLFKKENNSYEFSPTTSQRLKFSGIRNLLLDLEFINFIKKKNKYVISDEYFIRYRELKEPKQTSLSQFLKIIKEREDLAKIAEKEVIKYEKNRLSQFPHLIKGIIQVSKTDVGAGYDIQSFTIKNGEKHDFCERYIEVKAISQREFRFFWTSNEIEKAKLHGKNYYLYLVPVLKSKKFDLSQLIIVQNPYSEVYQNEKNWKKEIELLAITYKKRGGAKT